MEDPVSIRDFLIAISRLPEDKQTYKPQKWYSTQKEHWIGWLFEYNSPGAYNRNTTEGRDARFVYNHIVEPRMLLFLAQAAGVQRTIVIAARQSLKPNHSLAQQAAAVRKILPWELVAAALWSNNSVKPKPLRGSA